MSPSRDRLLLGTILAATTLTASGSILPAFDRATPDEKRPAAHAARGNTDYDAPTARWREGPARYLLTKDEDDAFRALTTDEDRAMFIQRFWASRDPVDSTPENEYRTLFYSRVAEANRRFTDSPKPGWKTDRGKIFILLGPPDDLEQEQHRDDWIADTITWRYRAPPGGEHLDALPVVRFTRDATGEYRLSNEIFLPGLETTAGIAFQVQAMQMKSLPEQKKVLDTILGARPRLDTSPFSTHRDFFRSGDGNTFAILTLGVRTNLLAGATAAPAGSAGPGGEVDPVAGRGRFEVVARLVGASPGLPTYDFTGPHGLRGGDDGPVLDPAGYLLFQGGQPIRPGTYTAFYGVIDHGSNQVYSFKETVEIPDFRAPHFMLSRITLASRLERVERIRTAYTTPFVLGNLRVLPRPDDVFRNGEDLAFYYQIYGFDTDPIDGRPDLDVEYRFFVAQDDGAGGLKFVPLGRPIRLTRQRTQVQGYALPLSDWPPATYRLRVQVTDNLSEKRSTEEVSFRVL
jgi:GWxTD domain-containing protein